MKVMYVFDMTDPEQKAEADVCAKAQDYVSVLSALSEDLRLKAKHGDGGEQVFAEKWRTRLYELADAYDVRWD